MSDKRLIDANALMRDVMGLTIVSPEAMNYANAVAVAIANAPTIDAVEVVRCKDCKHAIVNENHIDKPLICCLTKMVGTTDEDWFCANGKRKMDGGAEG